MSNIVLQPNASGTGNITITSPNTNTDRTLNIPDVAGNIVTTGDSGTVTGTMIGSLPTGSIVQVVSTTKTSTQSIVGLSFVEISGFDVDITPSSSSSKILILVDVHYGCSDASYPAFKLMRDSTHISVADTLSPGLEASFGHAGNRTGAQYRMYSAHHSFLDSPSTTSQVTYSVQGSPMRTSSQTLYINRAITLGDDNQMMTTSTITAMEIVG